jgi:trans-2-enoyl-CoA reductase
MENLIISLKNENDELKKVKEAIEKALKEIADNTRNEELRNYFNDDIVEIDNIIIANNEEIDDLYEEMNAESYEDWVADRNREYERMV